ncbi:hypothetical protein SI65_03772 [Aspergillus cristatus]|uniref:Uncharacterized protein n=1 Tax=Aspergillus cristatus TaxID=573508 RepID=A0A1E3BIE7_ASPCR|nr:hypothetical protein SI65_03772 [Aspergillus cristatus]
MQLKLRNQRLPRLLYMLISLEPEITQHLRRLGAPLPQIHLWKPAVRINPESPNIHKFTLPKNPCSLMQQRIYKDDWLESLGHEDSGEESEEEENRDDALLQERNKDLQLWLNTI